MFNYEFMQVAFIVGIMLSVVIPLIGNTVVFKGLSMTGDALSHTALAGVAIGLIAGVNPLITAIIASVISAFLIEIIRKKFYKYSEIAIAIVLSLGIGLAGVLSSFAPAANFNSYLFGSIIAISSLEVYITIGLFAIVVLSSVLFYKELMFISYNENNARLAGVPVNFVNFIFTLLTALTVAIASRTIGALIVSSLMVVPVATALQVSKSYKATIIKSVMFSMLSVCLGLIVSFYQGLKPGGTIVLISIVFLILAMLFKLLIKQIEKHHKHEHVAI